MTTQPVTASQATATRRRITFPGSAPALGLGAFGFLAAFAGSWNPSLWGDEAATILSAKRSLASLFTMLGHVDAVHGTYYLFMHFWIRAFGTSEVAVRLPSAIANGFTVAAVFVLASRMGSRRLGVVAAIVCALLPRMSLIGDDARSYAISTAIAAWLTILLVVLLDRQATSRRLWLGYAAGVAVGMYFFLYLGLLLIVHAVYVLAFRRADGVRKRWIQAASIGVLATLPVVVYGYAERAQIAFLALRHYATPDSVVTAQWFGDVLIAGFAWLAIGGALALGIVRLVRTRTPSRLGVLVTAWVIIPTALLLLANGVTPTYNLRYVSMSLPAVSIAIALGILAVRRRWLVIALTVLFCAATIQKDVGQRSEFATDNGSDWRQVSQYISTHSKPGDAVAFDNTVRNSRLPRLALRMYPQDYHGLLDVQLVTPYYATTGLWDSTASLRSVEPKLKDVTTVFLLELRGSHDQVTGRDVATLHSIGFRVEHTKTVNRTIVYTLTRSSPAS